MLCLPPLWFLKLFHTFKSNLNISGHQTILLLKNDNLNNQKLHFLKEKCQTYLSLCEKVISPSSHFYFISFFGNLSSTSHIQAWLLADLLNKEITWKRAKEKLAKKCQKATQTQSEEPPEKQMFDLQNYFKYTLYQDVRFSAICSLEITFLLKKNTNLYLSDWAIFGVDRLLRRSKDRIWNRFFVSFCYMSTKHWFISRVAILSLNDS